MILVFGGTTEGRKAVEVLEEAGKPYYYSTKTGEQDITLHNGQRIDGALNREAMEAFCQEHSIRLMVDAAHPFATQLHQTIADVAGTLTIPVVRYERMYPPRDPSLIWIDDYSEIPTDIHSLLATTGVQSISRLKWLEAQGVKVIYRILNRESSIRLAHQQGATDEQLCFYPQTVEADAMLMKESGESGGFSEKMTEAKERGMRIIVLKRPELSFKHVVDGPYGLRRAVEKLLPAFYPLHSGLTTGTCATAAAVAATLRLMKGETPDEVPVILPNGETIMVSVGYADDYAYCIKEAGDDPDVTDGIKIECRPTPPLPAKEGVVSVANGGLSVCVYTGVGIGRFTLPGFDFPPGEPAINRGPRKMLAENLQLLLDSMPRPHRKGIGVGLSLSIPQGEAIAKKTFNPRLGIEGGISIIGMSGIVKPFSEEAFIESIRKCMEVAKASGTERIVIHSGMKSEGFLRQYYPTLPQQAFIEYGNAIGATLQIADKLNIPHLTLGIMLGKAVKLAEGHLDTHSKKQTMNKAFIVQMLEESGCTTEVINQVASITLARELWGILPPEQTEHFCRTVIRHCMEHCKPLLPHGHLTILLIDDGGGIHRGGYSIA